jgi:hypothetical protein
MNNGTPYINGQVHSAASVEISVNGVTVFNVKEINYEDKQEITEVYGLQANPVGRSEGKITREGSITLGAEEVNALVNVAPNRRLQELNLTIIVSYALGTTPVIHTLSMCKPKNNGRSVKSGDNELSYKIELSIGNIKF